MKVLKLPIRFLGIFALVLSAALLGNAGTAAAANPLLCFSGTTDGTTYGGVCTILPGGTSATLNNTGGDPDGSYSGVYYASSNLSGKLVSSITQLSFDYTGVATAGSPRISLPIDTNNDGSADFYAFIGASACGVGGHVDIHNAGCLVFWTAGPVSGESWATFSAHGWRVAATAPDNIPFVIADDAGIWTVSNVQLGQGEAASVATAKAECKNGGWANLTRTDGTTFKNQGDCIQYVNTGK